MLRKKIGVWWFCTIAKGFQNRENQVVLLFSFWNNIRQNKQSEEYGIQFIYHHDPIIVASNAMFLFFVGFKFVALH